METVPQTGAQKIDEEKKIAPKDVETRDAIKSSLSFDISRMNESIRTVICDAACFCNSPAALAKSVKLPMLPHISLSCLVYGNRL